MMLFILSIEEFAFSSKNLFFVVYGFKIKDCFFFSGLFCSQLSEDQTRQSISLC